MNVVVKGYAKGQKEEAHRSSVAAGLSLRTKSEVRVALPRFAHGRKGKGCVERTEIDNGCVKECLPGMQVW